MSPVKLTLLQLRIRQVLCRPSRIWAWHCHVCHPAQLFCDVTPFCQLINVIFTLILKCLTGRGQDSQDSQDSQCQLCWPAVPATSCSPAALCPWPWPSLTAWVAPYWSFWKATVQVCIPVHIYFWLACAFIVSLIERKLRKTLKLSACESSHRCKLRSICKAAYYRYKRFLRS